MRSDVTVMQDDQRKILPEGNRKLDNVKWVYQDKIGYIFPEQTTINLSNQDEQGRWSDITDQKNISQEIVSEKVFMLWFDHGNRPGNASYQYIVVPDVGEEELNETSSDNRHIEVLSNTSDLQAVKSNKLNICQMAFYRAGELELTEGFNFRMESQGMAMLKMAGNRMNELSLADPSRKLSSIFISVSGIYNVSGDGFVALTDSNQNKTYFVVELPQGVYAGKSVSIKL
jgi:chondroitin AC lyase